MNIRVKLMYIHMLADNTKSKPHREHYNQFFKGTNETAIKYIQLYINEWKPWHIDKHRFSDTQIERMVGQLRKVIR